MTKGINALALLCDTDFCVDGDLEVSGNHGMVTLKVGEVELRVTASDAFALRFILSKCARDALKDLPMAAEL